MIQSVVSDSLSAAGSQLRNGAFAVSIGLIGLTIVAAVLTWESIKNRKRGKDLPTILGAKGNNA